MESNVKAHYDSDQLIRKITRALRKAGKDISRIEPRDLSPVDQLHTGGARASLNLLKKAGLTSKDRVLDVGCGIGGSSRLMAGEPGCRVTGLDLSDRFIECAGELTRMTGLGNRVDFKTGSVLNLPFEDGRFDAVVVQHLLMNIEDKTRALEECRRVLKAGGKLILHEIIRGGGDELLYPVPWAGKPSISFLDSWEKLLERLHQAGFESVFVSDESETARLWWEKVKAMNEKRPIPPGALGPALIFGDNAAFFGRNMAANFKNQAIRLFEALFKKIRIG